MDEFLARLRAAVRRGATAASDAAEPVVHTAAFSVDLAAKRVTRHGDNVRLTPTEWGMLGYLVRHPDRLVDRRSCSTRCGARLMATKPTIYVCIWLNCGASSNMIRLIPSTC